MYHPVLFALASCLFHQFANADFFPRAALVPGNLHPRGAELVCPETLQTACPGGIGCCPTGAACVEVMGAPQCGGAIATSASSLSINPGGPIITTSASTSSSVTATTETSTASTSPSMTSSSMTSSSMSSSTSSSTTASSGSSTPGQASPSPSSGMASLSRLESTSWMAIMLWITNLLFAA
ncbi:hypothetical protein N7510_002613 [Penicillium lagena]|uniref:uncharacterized protein n=1 Tax=Penicillium lagena TaxID=94218 RepID=UPI00254036ED|nr:uncharacterized protein N7510_002613 [Penicillium lagena]KAJ5626304.1 hypothetical protein N7510_002613 [Penicillium lagena]